MRCAAMVVGGWLRPGLRPALDCHDVPLEDGHRSLAVNDAPPSSLLPVVEQQQQALYRDFESGP
jgi:hypothetical protein